MAHHPDVTQAILMKATSYQLNLKGHRIERASNLKERDESSIQP